MKQEENRGGARSGAGRKRKVNKYFSIGVYETNMKALKLGQKHFTTTQLFNDALKYYYENGKWAMK